MDTSGGVVAEFDDAIGTGTILSDDRRFGFHCTQLADGSRTVDPGTYVTFDLRAGGRGTWEAVNIRPTSPSDRFACPVCGQSLLGQSRTYEICDRCGWEDDPVQFDDPSAEGGANESSLNQARTEWIAAQRSRG